ncbi:hypothetical protein [Flavimaricola marinus]|nr:hypothetical protein [Flavimaricola marinus]
MRAVLLALCVAGHPASGSALELDGGRATLQFGAFAGETTFSPFRVHGDALMLFGQTGVQFGATYGSDDLTDLHVIGFRNIGRRWRIGAELQSWNDPALAGADLVWGLRIRYSDAGGTVDTRGGLVHNGPDGAFFVTVAMEQNLTATASVRGMLHRYSTNPEAGDFFAIGLGGDVDISDDWAIYADGIWSLSDDYSTETTGATIGLRHRLNTSHSLFAGLSGHSVNGDVSGGITAGLSLSLDRPGSDTMFDTDPWQMQLAQIRH